MERNRLMLDPRITLQNATLTSVRTTTITASLPLIARSTHTHPDEPRTIPKEGLYVEVDQDPTAEGEMIIYYHEEFGIPVAEPFVAVEINGSLIWKTVSIRKFITDSQSGKSWR